jgi:hypothetical protein
MPDLPTPGERVIDFDGRDRAADEERGKELELRRQRHAVFLKRELNDPVFRDWMWSLLDDFGTFTKVIAASPTGFPDPRATDYHDGRRSCGWRIWVELDDAAPELASLMRRERS